MTGIVRVAHYIGGAESSSETTREIQNPARPSEVVAVVPVGDAGTAAGGLAQARRALADWARTPAPQRGEILHRASTLLTERAESIGEELCREEGKTLGEAVGETRRAAAILRYFAGRTLEPIGEVYASGTPTTRLQTLRQPVGVIAVITPWNFPIAIPAWKIAPALAYGNTVVFKPATATPLTAYRFVEALVDAGLPRGVVNLVHAPGGAAEDAWFGDGGVDALSFTGSSVVGRHLQSKAVAEGIKVQLELGGKNAVVVANDADVDLAARAISRGAFMSAGQKCTATSRVIAFDSVSNDLRDALEAQVRRLVIGDPLGSDTVVGPLIDADARQRVANAVTRAQEEGARIIARADAPDDGWFSPPTVLDNVDPGDSIAQVEIFGPVVAVMDVPDLEAALQAHDAVGFGLSSAIFTRDLRIADAFVQRVRAGIVHVNGETAGAEPHVSFGGMKGSSSWSREQGHSAEEFYTQTKTVYWDEMDEAGLFDVAQTSSGMASARTAGKAEEA